METAVVLKQSELAAAPVIAAPPEHAPMMTLSSYGGKLTREQLSRVPRRARQQLTNPSRTSRWLRN